MKHLKIYEDYFGNQDYVNQKDLDFFNDLISYMDDYSNVPLKDAGWNYNELSYKDGRIGQTFKKEIGIYRKDLDKTVYKTFEISKISFQPTNVLDTVKDPYYESEYYSNKLEIPQEKLKEIFTKLFRKYTEEKHRNARGIEDERQEDLEKILKNKVGKYNL